MPEEPQNSAESVSPTPHDAGLIPDELRQPRPSEHVTQDPHASRLGRLIGNTLHQAGLISYDSPDTLAHQRPLDREGEWDGEAKLNRFQRVAKWSKGWLTLANLVSFAGAAVTLKGIYDYSQQDVAQGLVEVAAGRLLDLGDGVIAAWTKTRGKVGALVDAGLDKLLSTAGLAALTFETHDLPVWLSAPIFAQQVAITTMNRIIHNRGGSVTPNRAGKWGMAALWGYLGAPIAYRTMEAMHWEHAEGLRALGYISGVGALALSAISIYDYHKQLKQLPPKSEVPETI